MKKRGLKRLVCALPVLASLALFGCTNDIDSASTSEGIDNSADDSMTLPSNDGKSDKDARKELGGSGSGNSGETGGDGTVIDFGDDFIRGFDASAVDYYENNVDGKGAVTYKDTDGTTLDFFKILANHGYDTVRLRIWNDPSQVVQSDDNPPVGDNTLARTISMAKRIKAAGLKLMLDFHYSDYWTDPGKQYVPRAWLDAASADDVASKLSDYTTEVLTALKEQADVVPAYVQIGNEINSGMVRDKTIPNSTSPDFTYAGTGDKQTEYLKFASEAVRNFDASIKIIVHVTSSNQPTSLLNRLKTAKLVYDIIGLSYYPWEVDSKTNDSAHGTIQQMKTNISSWKTTYSKDVMVVECSALWDGNTESDSVNKRKVSALDMIDSESSLYSDLETEDVSGTTCLKVSVASAKAVLRHIMQETYDAGGIGCVAWGGDMHGDWNRAMFTWEGVAMDNIDAFNYKPSGGYTAEDASDDDTGGDSKESYDEMTLKFDFPESLSAGTISVLYYKADGASSSGKTVDATVTDNSASVTLSSEYATDWGFNAKITVKNTSGTDITSNVGLGTWTSSASGGATNAGGDCEKSYFAFTKDSTLTVVCTDKSEAPTVSMSLVLDFSAVSGVTSVSGEYYKADSSEKTTIASTNLSNSKATITISGKYSDGDWINVEITPTGGSFLYDSWTSTVTDGEKNAGGGTENNKCWFQFYKDSTLTATLKAVDTGGGTEGTSMTVTLVFDDFECTYMKLWYGNSSGEDVEVTLADDKKSGSFTAKKEYANDSGWYGNMSLHNVWNGSTDLSNKLAAASGYNLCFEFNAEGTTIHLVSSSE